MRAEDELDVPRAMFKTLDFEAVLAAPAPLGVAADAAFGAMEEEDLAAVLAARAPLGVAADAAFGDTDVDWVFKKSVTSS